MKEIYDWVPWFKELSSTIAENGEAFLVERAKQVPWKEDGSNPALLLPGDQNINPFSFIDTEALSLFRSLSTRAYSARALGLPRSRPRSTDSRGGEAGTIPPAPPGPSWPPSPPASSGHRPRGALIRGAFDRCAQPSARCAQSPPRSPPACRARFGFSAEIPLAARGADPRAFVVAIAGHVVDAPPAVVADVALDFAATPLTSRDARRVPGDGRQALTPAPVPRWNQFSSPQSALRPPRRRFLIDVRRRVPPIGYRPTLANEPGIDVLSAVPAHGNDASIPIPIALLARDRTTVDAPGKRPRRLLTARPAAVTRKTALGALRCIHSK